MPTGSCRWCGGHVGQIGSTRLCRGCLDAFGGDYKLLKVPAAQHTARGEIRGCTTRVIADDPVTADDFLSLMKACTA